MKCGRYPRPTVDCKRRRKNEFDRYLGSVFASCLEKDTDRVHVDLTINTLNVVYMWQNKVCHLETQVKVVFGASRHDSMETVDRVWDAKGGREKRVNLGVVRQIDLQCDGLCSLRCLGLYNVGKNKLDVGRLGVISQGVRELRNTG
jgi:hypothetical protein